MSGDKGRAGWGLTAGCWERPEGGGGLSRLGVRGEGEIRDEGGRGKGKSEGGGMLDSVRKWG